MAAMGRIGGWAAWGVMTFLCVGVGLYALFHVATGFQFVPASVMNNGFPTILGVQAHIAASGFALIFGPFQFLKRLRMRRPRLHRWMGYGYVAACMTGGLAGGLIAMTSTAGPVAGTGFLTLAVLWLAFTGLALRSALGRDFAAHERWMIRSFALTFGAVVLRIYLPIGMGLSGGEFFTPYRIIAWISWVPNLILAELWIRTRGPRLRRPRPAPQAGLAE